MKFTWRDLEKSAGPLAVLMLAFAVMATAVGLIIDTLLGHKLQPIDQSALSSILGAAIGVVGTYIGLTLGQRRNGKDNDAPHKDAG